jgi:LmbE family N-acetylglucosaminyl deacetylase
MMFPGPPPWIVPPASFPRGQRVAVMAPHPDDFDCIAVTLRLLHENDADINVAVLTSGASGVEDDYVGCSAATAKARVREAEQLASCMFFGLPRNRLRFLRLGEDNMGHLAENIANEQAILHALSAWQPQWVFMPHGNDPNAAHRRTHALVRRCLANQRSTATVLLNRDAKTLGMREDLYVQFDERQAQWKREMLRFHDSQQSRNLRTRGFGFDARILNDNAKTAANARLKSPYAEAFEVVICGGRTAHV